MKNSSTTLPKRGEPSLERPADFARRVAISPRTCANWIRQNRIPFLKVGRVVLIPWKEAIEHLNNRYRIRAAGERKEGA